MLVFWKPTIPPLKLACLRLLLDVEELCSSGSQDLVETFNPAESLNLDDFRVVRVLEPFHEAELSHAYSDFYAALHVFQLVRANLRVRFKQASVLLDAFPFLNKIDQYFHLKLCRRLKLKTIWRFQGNSL